MLRFLAALALVCALTSPALAEAPARRLSLGLGPAFWLELGDPECREHSNSSRTCTSALRTWYGGLRAEVDYEVQSWLRVGGQFGFGLLREAQSLPQFGESLTLRRWLVPMGVHLRAHTEPRPGLSLWLGPEVLYALRVDELVADSPSGGSSGGNVRSVVYAASDEDRAVRSGLMLGLTMGLDARLAQRVWLGSEIALALSFVEEGAVGTIELESVVTAMLRTGLVLRVLL